MNIQTLRNRGFTLIELLVVIAIIGILAAVVLAALNSARDKGSDAAIKSDINNARAQAELFYQNNGNTYKSASVDMCTDAGGVTTQTSAADTANGGGAMVCSPSDQAWAIEAQLVSDTSKYYCVDSNGKAEDTTALIVSGTDFACP